MLSPVWESLRCCLGVPRAIVERPGEEYVLYVTEGSGTLIYGMEEAPLRKDDFLYIPSGVRHGVMNQTDNSIKVLFMGYRIPEGVRLSA